MWFDEDNSLSETLNKYSVHCVHIFRNTVIACVVVVFKDQKESAGKYILNCHLLQILQYGLECVQSAL